MKFLLILLTAALPLHAFDSGAFGARLNGWTRDGSAHYSLSGQQHRTRMPVVVAQPDGGEIVTVTVIHRPNHWAEVPFELTVVISPQGQPLSCRITGSPRGRILDTGAIPPPAAPEGDTAWDPLVEMKKQLFARFEPQATQAAETRDTRKRDLLARSFGPEPIDVAAISAGLRYNLDLLLGHARGRK